MKRRLISFLLAFCIFIVPANATDAGDGNMTGGGGSTGSDTSHGSWNPGNDGVRVSIVEISSRTTVATVDYTNAGSYISQYESSIVHFGKNSKLNYLASESLSTVRVGNYTAYSLSGLPRIISTNGSNNITAIKTFFTKEGTT